MQKECANDWWEIRVNGRVLTTVVSEERAVWFLEKLRSVDVNARWELVSVGAKPWARPLGPEDILKNRKVEYCVGSD